MVLGDGTEVRMGNIYGQGGEWEIRGEVRKWTDVPLQIIGRIEIGCIIRTGNNGE
jgi:hypothetical protein